MNRRLTAPGPRRSTTPLESLDAAYLRRIRAVVAEMLSIADMVQKGVGTHGSPNSGEQMAQGIIADAKRIEFGADIFAGNIARVLTLPEWKP